MFRQVFLATCLFVVTSNQVVSAEEITTGFSPGNALSIVVDAINDAEHSIDIAAYSFTSRPIAKALLDAHDRGVKIRVVGDFEQSQKSYSSFTYLANHGVDVRINDKYRSMHNKFMVIDSVNVETGSFNFTAAAAKDNAENLLFVKNSDKIAASYEAEFVRLYTESNTLPPRY